MKSNGNAELRRENAGAEGAEMGGIWGGIPIPSVGGAWERAMPPPQKIF